MQARTCTHAHACAHTCTHMHAHMYADVCACTHTNTICVCAHVYRRMHTGACACTHAHAMHAVHTHAHVCTHTNVHADRCVWRSGFTCACCREAKRSQLTMEAARPRWACHVAATQACRLSAGAWWISCSLASMAGRLLVKKLSVQRSSGSACGGATALTHLVGTDSPGGNRLSETARHPGNVETGRAHGAGTVLSSRHVQSISVTFPCWLFT